MALLLALLLVPLLMVLTVGDIVGSVAGSVAGSGAFGVYDRREVGLVGRAILDGVGRGGRRLGLGGVPSLRFTLFPGVEIRVGGIMMRG